MHNRTRLSGRAGDKSSGSNQTADEPTDSQQPRALADGGSRLRGVRAYDVPVDVDRGHEHWQTKTANVVVAATSEDAAVSAACDLAGVTDADRLGITVHDPPSEYGDLPEVQHVYDL